MRLLTILWLTALLAQAQDFEVASVRPHKGYAIRSGSLAVSGSLIRLDGYTVYGLLLDSWHLGSFQISLGPAINAEDVAGNMYDIVARTPGDGRPKLADVRIMLQHLLTERFHIATHMEMRVMDVSVMELASHHPVLKPSTSTQSCAVHTIPLIDGRNDDEILTNCPIDELAGVLSGLLTRPVLDHTGLDGLFDFHFQAISDIRSRGKVEDYDIDPTSAAAKLGFKLKNKRAAVPILVVDHLEKLSPN